MEYAPFGSTGHRSSRIIFGAAALGAMRQEKADQVLAQLLPAGVNHIDTAASYGDSELRLAPWLRAHRAEVFLASKTGIVVDGARRGVDCSPEYIATDIDKSLALLETDFIDLYYMHRFDPKVPVADSVGALVRAIEAGKIGAYGVSEWSSAHVREAHAVHPMAAVQTEYSLWTRNVELGVLETCEELGIALVAFSPLGRGALCGVLTDPATLEDKDLRTKMPRFQPENWAQNRMLIEQFVVLAEQAGVTPAQLALKWVLSRGDNVHVIPGTTNPQHLADNVRAAEVEVSPAVLDEADGLINHDTVAGHRYHAAILPTIDTEEFA